MRFFVGLLVGLFLLGGYLGYQWYRDSRDPCLGRCGEGTACQQGLCEVQRAAVATRKKKKRRRRGRRRRNRRRAGSTNSEPALRKVSAADRVPASTGPSLRQADYINMAKPGGGGRELSTSQINAKVRPLGGRIVACIDRARGDHDLRRGKVVLAFRIERSGRVKKVRITAPRVLQRGGLSGCITPLVRGLRFGPTARSLIMTYPYQLN